MKNSYKYEYELLPALIGSNKEIQVTDFVIIVVALPIQDFIDFRSDLILPDL